MKAVSHSVIAPMILAFAVFPTVVQTPSPTPFPDLFPSGWIDTLDLLVFSAHWNEESLSGEQVVGDLSGNGRCGPEDLFHLIRLWHTSVPRTPTITPTDAFTTTPTPTGSVVGASETITVDIPGLPTGARPMRLILIPAGTFQMGSQENESGRNPWVENEGPVHTVTITEDFYMGETEVTQAQWLAVMGTWPDTSPSVLYGQGNDFPAYWLSWRDVADPDGFLDRLDALSSYSGFRLPTEAEWSTGAGAVPRQDSSSGILLAATTRARTV